MEITLYERNLKNDGGESGDREIVAARNYLPSQELVNAVNVALLLGYPLLLTGEPGTGKTQLAASLAWQLNLKKNEVFLNSKPLIFETKSSSGSRDLFYTYDMVGRFHAAQIAHLEHQTQQAKNRFAGKTAKETEPSGKEENISEENKPTREQENVAANFITYNALGLAILHAKTKTEVLNYLPKNAAGASAELLEIEADKWQRRSVVLIDEIDKAPRDFPNDILNEIDKMYFRVPELGGEIIKAEDEKYRPVVVLTSNSEKNLPDAFLRRCVYHHIEFPKETEMKEIVKARLEDEGLPVDKLNNGFGKEGVLVKDAINLFYEIRKAERNLKKIPATAELLGWLRAVREFASHHNIPANQLNANKGKVIEPTLGVLMKFEEDLQVAREIVKGWA